MAEFRVQCEYYGERKNRFFRDKKEKIYHMFSVINADDLPDKYFRSLWKGEIGGRDCRLWISSKISKEVGINWEKGKDYCFVMNLGEENAATFNIKNFRSFHPENTNSMVLKTKKYFENTVKKIGFWGSENYFYELGKNGKKPSNKPNNNPSQSENKNHWTKILFVCLPIAIIALFCFLIVKWVGRKRKKIKL